MSSYSSWRILLLVLFFSSFVLITNGKGGRGGGIGRSGGSRGGGWGSSSRSSSSSRSRSSSSNSGSSSGRGSSSSSSVKYPSSYNSQPSLSAVPPVSSKGIPAANYPRQQFHPNPVNPLNPQPSQSNLNANYPRQTFNNYPSVALGNSLGSVSHSSSNAHYNAQNFHPVGNSQQGHIFPNIPNANYPRQPISSIQGIPSLTQFQPQSGISNANYPRQQQPSLPQGLSQSGFPFHTISQNPGKHVYPQTGISNANYPTSHQSSSSQLGFQNANYPRQAIIPKPSAPILRSSSVGQLGNPAPGLSRHPSSGMVSNYPRQPTSYNPQILGTGVWNPQSGMPAPVYMNYGGIPTGRNMYTKPMKKQGFLGSLMTMGSHNKPYKNKHYVSYPNPYGVGGSMGGFMGSSGKGSKAAMYSILPYMAARKAPKVYKPKFKFYSYYPVRYHHLHPYMPQSEYGRTYYDVYSSHYVGNCNRPIRPDHAKVGCSSTTKEIDCEVSCEEGYRYPDNTTRKANKCWHVTGTWHPTKNFEACKPVCAEPCLNGGKCVSPGVCGCPSEYRGLRCESHFLKCDIRKLADGAGIRWMCTHAKNGTSCRVRCPRSPTEEETLFECTPEGDWTPKVMPLCDTDEETLEDTKKAIVEDRLVLTTSTEIIWNLHGKII